MRSHFPSPNATARALCTLAVASLFCLSAAHGQNDDEAPSLDEAFTEYMGALEEARNTELPEVVAFTEPQLKGTLEATKRFQAMGLDEGPDLDTDAPGFAGMSQSLSKNAKAMGVLRSQKLTAEQYTSILYSIGIAMQAVESDPQEMREEWAAMQEMPAEDRAIMEQLMGPLLKMMEQVVTQPQGNIDLVRQYLPQIEAMGEE